VKRPRLLDLTFGSLFAGIGGFDLGLERAGLKCVWQVEIDEFCRRVLAKHWPEVRRHDDVKTFPPSDPSEWRCDVICGGFPCQDISNAGKGEGIDGERSGLWSEFARIVGVLRPRIVIVENVSALLGRGMDRVLGDLASLWFDAEWHCIPAAAFGAPHIRDRTFILANATGLFGHSVFWSESNGNLSSHAYSRILADAYRAQGQERESILENALSKFTPAQRSMRSCRAWDRGPFDDGPVDDGISCSVDSLDSYGNAVSPWVAEYIGHQLIRILTNGEGP
jgi:DNA (cytosine-5)-methyltransferase 1